MLAWAKTNGCSFPSLGIARSPTLGFFVVAREEIGENRDILRVPFELMINVETVKRSWPGVKGKAKV